MVFAVFRAHIAALLAVLLAVWPAAAFAPARYFCRMMDRVVDTCCCGQGAHERSNSGPEARPPDCCEKLTTGALPSADTRRDALKSFASPALLPAPEQQLLALEAPSVLGPAREWGRYVSARGPPLFLRNCVLLI